MQAVERGGRTHTLRVLREYAVQGSADGGAETWQPTGVIVYRTASGQAVTALPDGTFMITRTRTRLRSRDGGKVAGRSAKGASEAPGP